MNEPEHNLELPQGDPARQAMASLRGYLYQAVAAALAWTRLEPQGLLLLEVAEDYSTLINQQLTGVQVKDTAASGRITLNSEDVQDAIASFIDLVQRNPGRKVELLFLTTATITTEQSLKDRPGGKAGLVYWSEAASGATVAPLRALLESDKFSPGVRAFCVARTDEALRRELLIPIRWVTGQPAYDALWAELEAQLVILGRQHFQFPSQEMLALAPAIHNAILQKSILANASARTLTLGELYATIDDATHISVPRHTLMGALALGPIHPGDGWAPIRFGAPRGWTPALLGRALVPADALTCPPLSEVGSAIQRLEQDHLVHLLGKPGSGKSICAYQVAHHFYQRGWETVQLQAARHMPLTLPPPAVSVRRLYLIDDAHLHAPSQLKALDQAVGPDCLVLCLHNATSAELLALPYRHAIVLNSQRAVKTIAAHLRHSPGDLLAAIRQLDNQVGEQMLDTSLGQRITQAEDVATFPWHFCFILSGGWRRARQAAEAAQAVGADLALAAVAMRQLASRDENPALLQLSAILRAGSVEPDSLPQHLTWLTHERWLMGATELRCPHQHFAGKVLLEVIAQNTPDVRRTLGAMMVLVLQDEGLPLLGKRALLHELRFGQHPWTHLITLDGVMPNLQRCWDAVTHTEIAHAAWFLSDMDAYIREWPAALFADRIPLISHWISHAGATAGTALGRLVSDIANGDQPLAIAIITGTDPVAMAIALSAPTPENAYAFSRLLSAFSYARETDWGTQFKAHIDRAMVIHHASHWQQDDSGWAFSEYCRTLLWIDPDFALDVIEAFLPTAQRLLAANAVEGFEALQEICWHGLRCFDPLNSYRGDNAPTSRQKRLAKAFLAQIDTQETAVLLSSSPLRDFQRIGFVLSFIRKVNSVQFNRLVVQMDWHRIANTIGPHWADLPHEAETLLGIAWCTASEAQLTSIILANLPLIDLLPPRLALMCPMLAWQHLATGKTIKLANRQHVDWTFGTWVLAMATDEKPSLMSTLVKPHTQNIATVMSQPHPSFYADGFRFMSLLFNGAESEFGQVLDQLNVATTSQGWRAGLTGDERTRNTVAFLIEACLHRQDALGDLANTLRREFPKASTLKKKRRKSGENP